jgi:hypothetical protein
MVDYIFRWSIELDIVQFISVMVHLYKPNHSVGYASKGNKWHVPYIAKKGRLWICLVLYCQSPESCSKNNEPLYFTLQDTLVQSAFAFVFDFSVLLGDNLNWFFSDSQQAFRARISLCSRTTLVEIATQSTTWIDLLSNIIIFKGRTIRFLKGGGGNTKNNSSIALMLCA